MSANLKQQFIFVLAVAVSACRSQPAPPPDAPTVLVYYVDPSNDPWGSSDAALDSSSVSARACASMIRLGCEEGTPVSSCTRAINRMLSSRLSTSVTLTSVSCVALATTREAVRTCSQAFECKTSAK